MLRIVIEFDGIPGSARISTSGDGAEATWPDEPLSAGPAPDFAMAAPPSPADEESSTFAGGDDAPAAPLEDNDDVHAS